jgi:preprotein translocase subunit SecF
LPPTKLSTEVIRGQIEQILRGIDAGAQIQQVEVIGPQVGGELRTQRLAGADRRRCC